MTSVNVSTNFVNIEVTDSSTSTVVQSASAQQLVNVSTNLVNIEIASSGNTTVVQTPTNSQLVDVVTVGPQGPAGSGTGGGGSSTFSDLQDVDATLRQDQSVVYYNAASAKFKVDGANTILSLTDGGNF